MISSAVKSIFHSLCEAGLRRLSLISLPSSRYLYLRVFAPDMYRTLQIQSVQAASFDTDALAGGTLVLQPGPAGSTEVAADGSARSSCTTPHANGTFIRCWNIEVWEDSGDAKRRGGLSLAFDAVADIDCARFGERCREGDGTALAATFHFDLPDTGFGIFRKEEEFSTNHHLIKRRECRQMKVSLSTLGMLPWTPDVFIRRRAYD